MGWLLANILVPVLVPVVVMAYLYSCADNAHRDLRHPILLFKDGQLGWMGIAFGASAFSEISDWVGPHGVLRWACLLAITFSMLSAVAGVIEPATYPNTPVGGLRLFRNSAIVAFLAALLFIGTHYQHEIANFGDKIKGLW